MAIICVFLKLPHRPRASTIDTHLACTAHVLLRCPAHRRACASRPSAVRLGLCLLLVSAFTGCSGVPAAKDGQALKPNQGLLAFKFTSTDDARLSFMNFSPESSFGSRMSEYTFGPKGSIQVSAGEKYYLVPLDAGEYMWSRVDAGRKFAPFQASNRFSVHANTITYVGSFRLIFLDDKVTLSVLDREQEMRNYIEDKYPTYARSMSFDEDVAKFLCCHGSSR